MNKQIEKLEDNGIIDEDIVIIDGDIYVDALVGVTDDSRAVYDQDLIIEALMKNFDMTYEAALEYVEFNMLRSLPYLGKYAPIIFERLE